MAAGRSSTRISVRGNQTREQVLQAAKVLFSQRGYHNTSIYDLFEKSGISKGALFHHWKSKEELALSVLDEVTECFEKQFFVAVEREGRARDKIEWLLKQMTDVSAQPSVCYVRIFAIWCAELRPDEERVGPAVHSLRTRWCTLWKELVRRAQQEHDLRGDISAENLSFLVVSTISGVQIMSGKDSTVHSKTAYETLRRALLT
jgi:AcrR family transcriptional regulator